MVKSLGRENPKTFWVGHCHNIIKERKLKGK
jgi:hypothetical protein